VFLRLFHEVKAFNPDNKPFVLQFVAASHGEGASTLAAGFAEAAAFQTGKHILLVDCNQTNGSVASIRPAAQSLIEAFNQNGAIHDAVLPAPNSPGVALARLSATGGAFFNIDLGDLGCLFDMAKEVFSVVVLDCPPPSEAPESLSLARCSDGTVLVVGSAAAPRSLVAATKRSIERFGGQIVGVVLNRHQSYIPRWLQRWL
jgi:MinD-like ATPase involved in chromosome partitioning or flagellar assembly